MGVSMSSFDDGFHLGMTSSDDFRSKFAAILDEQQIGARTMCQRAGVDYDEGLRAIELGTQGLPMTIPTLQRLLSVFGLDMSWLVSGPEYVARNGPKAPTGTAESVGES